MEMIVERYFNGALLMGSMSFSCSSGSSSTSGSRPSTANAIIRKRLELDESLYQILQILSVTLFEKTPILQALQAADSQEELLDYSNQLNLFTL